MPPDSSALRRELGLAAAVSVSLGAVIGSGIFIGANRVAQGVSSPAALFAVWIGAGLASLLGALVYAEFAAALPRSGSDFLYVHRSLGPFWGFLTGWITLTLNIAASVGAIALAFASQLDALKPDDHVWLLAEGASLKVTAIALILAFSIVNIFGVRQGGTTQAFLTGAKVILIGALVVIGLSGLDASWSSRLADRHAPAAGGITLALVGALFATDGWNGVTRVTEEIKDPGKNAPRALIIIIGSVTLLYVLLNLAYLAALGFDGMAGSGDAVQDRLIASRAAEAVLGEPGKLFVSFVIMVSILGALNGVTLSGPRVYFAMARERLFLPAIARVHPRHRTPHVSILFQGVLASVLVAFFTFEQLGAYVVVGAWLSYLLAAIGLMRMRRNEPDLLRPYRLPFFPYTAIAFAIVCLGILGFLTYDAIAQAAAGDRRPLLLYLLNLVVLGLSLPAYLLVRRSQPAE